MSNTRNPKDIRGMVSGSERVTAFDMVDVQLVDSKTKKKDVDDMKSNLDKLKNLSEDDKKENAMLRSRIDEQCQLIMILKQRADDVQGKMSTLERINKELMDFRSNSQEMLNAELRKNSLLEKRFDELASNHQEMIKIKDEYKRSNQDLRQENSRLRDENARLFSGAIVEKDQQIADLEKKLASLKEQSGSQELKQRQSLQDLRVREQELQREIAGLQEQYRTDLKTLQSKLQDTEERLKGANYKLQNQMDDKKSADLESQTKIQSLVKEKDELLDLAMTRGKIIQKEQTENKRLQKKVEEMERAVRSMEEKFDTFIFSGSNQAHSSSTSSSSSSLGLTNLPQLLTAAAGAQGQILAVGPQVLNQLSLTHSTTSSSSTHSSQSLTNGHLPPSSSQPTPAQSAVQSAVQSAIRNAQSAKINNPASVSSLSEGLPPSVSQLLPNTVGNSTESTTVDGINLDKIKEFAKLFKIRRLSLGLTQTQVGQALSATEGPAYSQSAICRFEKLDITPKSAQKIKPVLERWMQEAEERYKNGIQNLTDFIGSEPSKKRKRRTSFTPQALEVLNNFFERNTHPSGAEMTELSDKLNYDREVIRVWFCNKRQALKNTIKKLKQETP